MSLNLRVPRSASTLSFNGSTATVDTLTAPGWPRAHARDPAATNPGGHQLRLRGNRLQPRRPALRGDRALHRHGGADQLKRHAHYNRVRRAGAAAHRDRRRRHHHLQIHQSPGSSPVRFDVPEGEGRVNTVSASAGQNAVTATPYDGFSEATGITFGSGYFFGPPGPDAVHRPKIACNDMKTHANPDSQPAAQPPSVVI